MEYFIARQPILDRSLRNVGYELLFRSGMKNVFSHSDPDEASRSVISDSSLLVGLKTLTEGKMAFFNITREVLVSGDATVLPVDQAVIELLESVHADEEVLAALAELRKRGYTVALDDFVYHEGTAPLVEYAQIIKLDFLDSTPQTRREVVNRLQGRNLRFLAEKVETEAAIAEARELGCVYFQGYFFSRPVIVRGRDVPGFKGQYLRVLQQLQRPDLDFEDVEQLIKHDLSISYKLLRYANSAAFGFRREIQSLNDAMRMLGEREVRKVLSVIALSTLGRDRPDQLLLDSLVRARFGEQLASALRLKDRSQDLFLLGMFSMIDAVIGRSMEEVMGELPIATDIKDALLGAKGRFASILAFLIAYERGEWQRMQELAGELAIDLADAPTTYLGAVVWSRESLDCANGGTDESELRASA